MFLQRMVTVRLSPRLSCYSVGSYGQAVLLGLVLPAGADPRNLLCPSVRRHMHIAMQLKGRFQSSWAPGHSRGVAPHSDPQ